MRSPDRYRVAETIRRFRGREAPPAPPAYNHGGASVYRSIETSLWDDPKVRQLPPHAKLLFVYLISNRHSHVSGIYILPAVLGQYDTGISSREWDTLCDTLSRPGLARFDPSIDVVWVVNMFRYQGRGEKVERSAAAQLQTLHNSFLIAEFCKAYPPVSKHLPDRVLDRASRPRIQEQEQEQLQEEEQEQKKLPCADKPARDRFEEFWKAYQHRENRGSKKNCRTAWKSRKLDEHADEILASLPRFKATEEWRGGFQPQAIRFLRGDLWMELPAKPDRDNGKPKKDHANVAPAHPCHGHKRGDKWHDAEDPDILHAIGLDGWWYRGTAGNAVKREKVV